MVRIKSRSFRPKLESSLIFNFAASSNQFGWDRKYVLKEADFHETNLADEIGVRWKDLARALGFNQASIEIIAKENINSVKECCIAVLVSWLRREGEGAITEKLVEALVRIRLTNVAERFTCKPSDQSQVISKSLFG